MTSRHCATHISLDGGTGPPSPFSQIVALGFDDGPTEGIVCCEDCSSVYRFEMLAIDFDGRYDHPSWDRGEELRVFALTTLPPETFDQIVERRSSIESPKWPVWAPGIGSSSSEMARVIQTGVAPILANAHGPIVLVATPALLASIVAVCEYPAKTVQPAPDWFATLGVAVTQPLATSTAG